MKNLLFLRHVLTCLGVFSIFLNLSCRKSDSPEPADVNQTAPQVDVQAPAAGVAVTVNGIDISESMVQASMEERLEELSAKASQLPPGFLDQYKKELRGQVLDRLVVEQLLSEKIKESNIEISDEEVIKVFTELLAAQPESLSLEEYKKKLAEYDGSFEREKERLRQGLAYQKFLGAQLAGKVNITQEDAQKFYDENPKRFEAAERVRVSHILIKPIYTEGGDPNEAKAEAKAKTEKLLKQISEGADFATLAISNSNCPSAPKGGDLGYFPRGVTTPPFEKVAFELALGQISDIVETEFGYHIIKATGHKDAGIVPFDEVKDDIIKQLTDTQQQELTNAYINSLKTEANIVYPPGAGQ